MLAYRQSVAKRLEPALPIEIGSAMATLSADYWANDMPTALRRARAESWMADLSAFPLNVIQAAIQKWRRGKDNTRFPKPGEFLDLCNASVASMRRELRGIDCLLRPRAQEPAPMTREQRLVAVAAAKARWDGRKGEAETLAQIKAERGNHG